MKTLKIIGLTVLAIVYLIIYRVNYYSAKQTNKAVKNSIGTYQLNITKSILKGYSKDSLTFSTLKLFVNQDMTFSFSKAVDFIYDSCGTWEYEEDGIYSYNRIIYKHNDKINDQFGEPFKNEIEFKMPCPKRDKDQVDLLVFKKIK